MPHTITTIVYHVNCTIRDDHIILTLYLLLESEAHPYVQLGSITSKKVTYKYVLEHCHQSIYTIRYQQDNCVP